MPIPVNVMDDFSALQGSAYLYFGHMTVLVPSEKFFIGRRFTFSKAGLRFSDKRTADQLRGNIIWISMPTDSLSVFPAHAHVFTFFFAPKNRADCSIIMRTEKAFNFSRMKEVVVMSTAEASAKRYPPAGRDGTNLADRHQRIPMAQVIQPALNACL